MVKNPVLFRNNSLRCYLAPFYDVILPINQVSLMFDSVTSFLCIINVRNACKCLHYSQTFGGNSSVLGSPRLALQNRATENRFFAGSDRFLVCKTDSVCIKRIFFGPKKTHTLQIINWPNFLD